MNILDKINEAKTSMLSDGKIEFQTKDIIQAQAFTSQLKQSRAQGFSTGLSLGWNNFKINGREIYTLSENEVDLITGIPNRGKTTFTNNIVFRTASMHHWKWAIFSPESYPAEEYLQELCAVFMGRESFYCMADSEIETALTLINKHCYLIDTNEVSIGNILSLIKTIHRTVKINAFVLDPYNEFSYTRPKELSETEYISLFMSQVKKFCRDENLHGFIVAHPTKPPKDADAEESRPTPYSISGSASWYSKADNILCVHRSKMDVSSNETQIHIDKIRRRKYGVTKSKASLFFNYKTQRLEDVPVVNALDYGRNIKKSNKEQIYE
ncbi:MAG TPA: hypothetical protein DD381_05470 [Lentisphaeria bacterium]|nr:MAG: hypothetical protein A2X47_06990 [Lentisphaerae bacterium GWF2_38_69]HBM15780.1 hypothetical protein [Lentisphaeria bacterium]